MSGYATLGVGGSPPVSAGTCWELTYRRSRGGSAAELSGPDPRNRSPAGSRSVVGDGPSRCRYAAVHVVTSDRSRAVVRELEATPRRRLPTHVDAAQDWESHEYRAVGVRPELRVPRRRRLVRRAVDPHRRRRLAATIGVLIADNLPAYHRDLAFALAAAARGGSGSAAGPPRRTATPSCCATSS